MATTGQAWQTDDSEPPKTWAWFDPNAVRDIPFYWGDWLNDIGSTYASHTVLCETGIESPSSSEALGIIKVRVRKTPAAPDLTKRKLYAVTCRITAADGQIQDQTLYLRITDL